MHTTDNTTSTAMADLDLDKLEALALAATPGIWEAERHGVIVAGPMRSYVNGSARSQIAAFTSTFHDDDHEDEPDRKQANAEFSAAVRPEVALALIALARRAAQPVAPVLPADVREVIKAAWRLVKAKGRYHTEQNYKALAAALDNLATPSPQVADIAELPGPWPRRMSSPPGSPEERVRYMQAEIDELRAIAASRRAAGGEGRDSTLESAVQAVADRAGDADKISLVSAFDAIRALKADRFALPESAATPAPASAGQAAPALPEHAAKVIRASANEIVRLLDIVDKHAGGASGATESIHDHAENIKRLAAQPAEGAGQAGQVAAYPYDALFWAIGDAAKIEGSALAISVREFVKTLTSKGYSVVAAERAAAPADQIDAAVLRKMLDEMDVSPSKVAELRAFFATHQPSAQENGNG